MLDDKPVGTFLVRDSSKDNCLVISLKQDGKVLHLLITRKGDKYCVDPEAWKGHSVANESFFSLDELLHRLKQHHGMLRAGVPNPAINPSSLGSQGKTELKRVLGQTHSENLQHEYKGMLLAMLRSGSISADELATLNQWREKNKFSLEEHFDVLKLLGHTPESFEKLKAFQEKVDEKNLCVICYDAPRTVAFVDCGHLLTCWACANKPELKVCPGCRTPKTKLLRVYT